MMRKKISQLLVIVLVSGLFVSCWDSFTERTYYSANITAFSFGAHDTCPDIEDYVFNIDQKPDTGLIYNIDSLPFGRVVNSLYPTITLQSTNGYIYFKVNGVDSLWEDGDSIDFSQPVYFKNTSIDGSFTRVYRINVNVHQLDPDSMVVRQTSSSYPTPSGALENKVLFQNSTFYSFFTLANGNLSLYKSSDQGNTWTDALNSDLPEEVNATSICLFQTRFYLTSKTGKVYSSVDGQSWNVLGADAKIKTLYGSISKKYINDANPNYLIGLAENTEGKICFARSANGTNWTLGEVIASDYPVREYAVAKHATYTGVESYVVATGLAESGAFSTKVWSTENGLNWVVVSKGTDARKSFVQRRGAALFYYDKYLVCLGGIDPNGNYTNDIHVSPDFGIGWIEAPENWTSLIFPEGHANTQVYVQSEPDLVNKKYREYIWIYGGTKADGLSSSVWNAALNSMRFELR